MAYLTSIDAELAGIKFNDELIQSLSFVGTLESSMNDLRRKELDIKVQKNALDEKIRMGKQNIKKLQIEIAQAKSYFWQLKRDNL